MKTVFFALKGSPIGFKLVPHTGDNSQLVIKAKHPEVGGLVAQIASTDVIKSLKGSAYYLTFVNKAAFLSQFGKIVSDVIEGNVVLLPPAHLQDVQAGPAVPVFNNLNDSSALEEDEIEEDESDEDDSEDEDY